MSSLPPSNAAVAGLSGLAGQLQLRPGAPLGHSLVNSRPAGLVGVLRGQPAQVLPGMLASLFSLCGPVHRLGATLLLRSADTGSATTPADGERRLLQLHTLRSHAQAVLMDWPRWLAADTVQAEVGTSAGLALLAGSPLRAAWPVDASAQAGQLADWARWLAALLFHQPLADWLAAWRADPQAALQAWVDRTAAASPVARWLQQAQPWACVPLPAQPALLPHARPSDLPGLLAAQLAPAQPGPQWQGRCAHTGPWSRLADATAQQPATVLNTPWLRLGARLADLAQLALPDGPAQGRQRLALGAVPLPAWPGQPPANGDHGGHGAIAWVETARGLLLQALWLAPPAPGAAPVLQHALVLSPTDWNAHPAGAWAQALAALPPGAPAPAVWALVAAYDPCVPCLVPNAAVDGASLREAQHA